LQEVANQIAQLAAQFLRGARDLGIQMKTQADSVGPLTVLKCKDSEALVTKLKAQDIVVSNRKDGLRVAFHVYNTSEDVEAVLEALKKNLDLLALQQ
jgi:cysteine desulfurase/selenocysteine lyase